MPIEGYFDTPFGVNGTLTPVPDGTQVSGSVSYNQGWSILYSTPVISGGINISRAQTNQLFYDVTSAIQSIQQGSPPAFITSTMNLGTPFTYPAGAIVSLGGVNYQSLVGSNQDTPPSAKWAIVPVGVSGLGAWASRSTSTIYQAATDGIIQVINGAGGNSTILTDSSSTPTTIRSQAGVPSDDTSSMSMVRKNDYWEVTGSVSAIYFLPLGV